ncbi:MAG TPA: pre-peptidase C-terminal domain-containing protein, partial [Candidatus Acidoferrales bacterium]|nr:pre-peptidase C-terminal domain-containing protein [Candidatus Acidoferrales bacterium]
PAADQYALGLIAYQMLTGKHPFPADNPLSALMAHVHKPVPLPSSLGVALPPGTEAALLRSLAKRPEERFPRSGDFVKALAGSTFISPASASAAASLSTPPTSPSQPPSTPPAAASEPEIAPLLSPSALVRPPEPIERPVSTPPAPPAERGSVMFPGRTAPVEPVKTARPWWKTWRLVLVPPALVVIALIGIGLAQRDLAKTPGATATAVQSIAAVTLPANESGTIASANEVDVYRFVVRANQDVQVELRLGTLADGGITLLDATNTQLANENAVGNSKVVTISYHIKDAGSYHVAVRGLRNSTGTYQLAITAR